MSNQSEIDEIKKLQDRIKELENTIKTLIWKSYHYRFDEIYHFFNKNGIRATAKKFDMPILDVINFITECDDSTCGAENADDYNECHIELYGKDNNSDNDSDNES